MDVSVYAAKTHLSRLIDQANAGEEVVITRHGRPVARLVPAAATSRRERKLGSLKGRVWMAENFDEPLPDDVLDLFEGRNKEPGTERP